MRSAVAFASLSAIAQAAAVDEANGANPIRKVVTMLQNIEKKVRAEAEAEEKLYDKYMCYCKNGAGELEAAISASDAKVPEVASDIKEAEAQAVQLKADLTSHKADRSDAKAAMEAASALRSKEAKAFFAVKTDLDTNIAAITKAVSSLEKGMAGAFLQTDTAQTLRNFVQFKASVSDVDREDIMAFLAGGSQEGYSPQSGEITGVLKTLGDEMSTDLSDATKTENAAKKSYDELMAAKTKQVNTLTKAIEEKTVRSGEVAVSIVQMKNDLSDTEASLMEDKKFLADMETDCASKEKEYAEMSKTRSEELVALAETIKLLNDDDALELFKKTLPSASASSFVQVDAKNAAVRSKAVALLRAAQAKADGTPESRKKLEVVMLALRGKKEGFASVIKMIDEMTALLKKEQTEDDDKKEYCEVSFDSTDDKKKELEMTISDAEKAAADAEEAIATLASEIKALQEGIAALDKSVVEATEQRKEENEQYKELIAQNSAAIDLLGLAKNRLNKFYNKALYKPDAKRQLSEEDSIAVSMGGTAPPTPAPGGIAGTGVTAFAQEAPQAPSYAKKSEETTGVIAMMDLLIKDLEKEVTEAETEEKDAQKEYEDMSFDAAKKRAADAKAATEKEAAKANTEAALQGHLDTKKSSTSELLATLEYIQSLHGECDWLLQYFDARKEARAGEIESLQTAKSVLSGADFSLVQTSAHRGSLRGSA